MLKKEIKETEKKYVEKIKQTRKKIKSLKIIKKDLRNLSIGRGLAIINSLNNAISDKEKTEEEKKEHIENSKEKIQLISKMNVFEYLKHINGKDEGEDENSESTMDDVEEKMEDLEHLIKNNKEINYKIKY